MKLFFFNPNDYGQEYSIMSDSKENALIALKQYLLKLANEEEDKYSGSKREYEKWKDATIDSLPEDYSIDVYEKDSVIETYNG